MENEFEKEANNSHSHENVSIANNQLISMLSILHVAMSKDEKTVCVEVETMEMLLVEVMLNRMNNK